MIEKQFKVLKYLLPLMWCGWQAIDELQAVVEDRCIKTDQLGRFLLHVTACMAPGKKCRLCLRPIDQAVRQAALSVAAGCSKYALLPPCHVHRLPRTYYWPASAAAAAAAATTAEIPASALTVSGVLDPAASGFPSHLGTSRQQSGLLTLPQVAGNGCTRADQQFDPFRELVAQHEGTSTATSEPWAIMICGLHWQSYDEDALHPSCPSAVPETAVLIAATPGDLAVPLDHRMPIVQVSKTASYTGHTAQEEQAAQAAEFAQINGRLAMLECKLLHLHAGYAASVDAGYDCL